jgi:hypothetical protein
VGRSGGCGCWLSGRREPVCVKSSMRSLGRHEALQFLMPVEHHVQLRGWRWRAALLNHHESAVTGDVVLCHRRQAGRVSRSFEEHPWRSGWRTTLGVECGDHHFVPIAPVQFAPASCPHHFLAAFRGDLPFALTRRVRLDVDLKLAVFIRHISDPMAIRGDPGPHVPVRWTANERLGYAFARISSTPTTKTPAPGKT